MGGCCLLPVQCTSSNCTPSSWCGIPVWQAEVGACHPIPKAPQWHCRSVHAQGGLLDVAPSHYLKECQHSCRRFFAINLAAYWPGLCSEHKEPPQEQKQAPTPCSLSCSSQHIFQ